MSKGLPSTPSDNSWKTAFSKNSQTTIVTLCDTETCMKYFKTLRFGKENVSCMLYGNLYEKHFYSRWAQCCCKEIWPFLTSGTKKVTITTKHFFSKNIRFNFCVYIVVKHTYNNLNFGKKKSQNKEKNKKY